MRKAPKLRHRAHSFSLAPARISAGRLPARPRYIVSRYTVSLANSVGNSRTSFVVDPPRPARYAPGSPASNRPGKPDSVSFRLWPPPESKAENKTDSPPKAPDFSKNLGNQGYPLTVANFADLCLTPHQPPSRRLPLRLAAKGFEENLSPAIGVINSVLIGALVWIGIVAAITLI